MTVVVDGETIEVTMDSVKEDYEKLRDFIKYVRDFIFGKPEEEY